VQRRAWDQVETFCNRLETLRSAAAAEQAKDGDGARDGGYGTDAGQFGIRHDRHRYNNGRGATTTPPRRCTPGTVVLFHCRRFAAAAAIDEFP
jgi:hypothetical protein